MKKIKKKKPGAQAFPAFLVGWTHGDPPPPGYLSAWFDQLYGGPLHIRFLSANGHDHFEAVHTNWKAQVELAPSAQVVQQWQGRLQWEHRHVAQLMALPKIQVDRQDEVLHLARIARGLTLLMEGTAYDVATGLYRNPSDWNDQDLLGFRIHDHVQVEQYEQVQHMRTWFHTRGLTKFGLDEVETFQPIGLSARDIEPMLYGVSHQLMAQGKSPKIGEQVPFGEEGLRVEVVRYRTDPIYGIPIAFREIRWA
jgi:hypothetical protein